MQLDRSHRPRFWGVPAVGLAALLAGWLGVGLDSPCQAAGVAPVAAASGLTGQVDQEPEPPPEPPPNPDPEPEIGG